MTLLRVACVMVLVLAVAVPAFAQGDADTAAKLLLRAEERFQPPPD